MALAIALGLGGLGLAYVLYVVVPWFPEAFTTAILPIYALVRDKFRIDELYDRTAVRATFGAADAFAEVDRDFVDGAVTGPGHMVQEASQGWRRLQSGNVQHYALSFLVGALVLVYWMAR